MDIIRTPDDPGKPEADDLRARLREIEARLEALPGDVAAAVRQAPVETLIDVKGVAEALGVSVRLTERLIADGEIRPIWIGGVRRFSRETIEAYIRVAARPRRRRAAR